LAEMGNAPLVLAANLSISQSYGTFVGGHGGFCTRRLLAGWLVRVVLFRFQASNLSIAFS
jgi:hypothetical protein